MDDDLQAIRRLKNGEIGGLEILIARHQVKAIRTAFLITHDESVAEDIVQDVFIRFFRRVRHFDERRVFRPYFMRCVVNAALDHVQKESKTLELDDDEDTSQLEALLTRATSVETQVEFLQLQREMLETLFRLPPRQRAVIVQRYYLEMSEKEMAETLEIAPGTVKWLLNAARSRLRALLGSERNAE
jgi:RNA polymerase sigma-70 factor (ECF subfamily)